MKTLLEILQEHGKPNLGYPSENTLEQLYEVSPDLDSLLHDMLTVPFRSPKVPLYHDEVEPSMFLPDKTLYVPYIQTLFSSSRYSNSHSVSQLKALLEGHGYKVSSNGQLTNIWDRVQRKIGLKAKPPKKQRPPNTSAQRKAAKQSMDLINAKRSQEKARKDLDRATRKVASKKAAAKQRAKSVETREAKAAQETTEVQRIQDEIKGRKVLYEPTPKQAEFHAASEKVVLYGGAAGGGKSYAIMMDILRHIHVEEFRGLIIRKNTKMLAELISVSQRIYPKAYPGANYNKSESTWYFPNGATIKLGYLDKDDDVDQYQGLPYTYIGFDEIQHQRSDSGFRYLMSRLRSAHPDLRKNCYIRATANPGGSPWVKEAFIDPAPPNTTFYVDGLSYRFIPAKLEDNPHLDMSDESGELSEYRKMLMSLPEVKRKQLLEGDWHVSEDSMFTFAPSIHVTSQIPPRHWSTIQALDYGYNDPAAALWGAVCPETGTIVVYQELECLNATHQTWINELKTAEGYVPEGVDRVIDWSLFKKTGHIGPTATEMFHRAGLKVRPADRSRENGWVQVAERLHVNPVTQRPTLLIHESCVKLIEQLQTARRNEKKPVDIDETRIKSKGRTHHWDLLDCLRYLLMARPQRNTLAQRSAAYKQNGWDRTYANFS